jgi:ubiquinone/menaquinone biosynthesis C-methylase UbiE
MSLENILDVRDGYRLWAPCYERGNAVIHVERRHTKSRLNEMDFSGKRILDLGCGLGDYAQIISYSAFEVIAVDQSIEMIERAKRKMKNATNIIYFCAESDSLDYIDDTSVDGLLCCLMIDHLTSAKLLATYNEIVRILRPNGWAYITDVDSRFLLEHQRYAKFIDQTGREKRIRVYPHSRNESKSFLIQAGFRKVKIDEISVNPEEKREWPELKYLGENPLIVEYFCTI